MDWIGMPIADVDVPEPEDGQVRVAVRAVGVNFPDVPIIEDKYQFKPERPFSPGAELAGVVDAIGSGVTSLKEDDRVMGLPLWGGRGDRIAVNPCDHGKVIVTVG